MAKIPVKYVEFYQPLFMNGNLGTKVTPTTKGGVKIQYDNIEKQIEVIYGGSVSCTHVAGIASWQPANPSDIGVDLSIKEEPKIQTVSNNVQAPHNELITKQARTLMAKANKTAQVSNPTKPNQGATVTGKPKPLGHAELRAQLAAEAKEVKPE